MRKVLLIGKSGRNDCLAEAIANSRHDVELYVLSDVENPSLEQKAHVKKERSEDPDVVAKFALEVKPDFAIIGPEEPLATGVVDRLAAIGVATVGPKQRLAQLESSKSYTRKLISEFDIPGNPEYRIFYDMEGLEGYLRDLGAFVIKPDGLTSGKGVQVFGDHLKSVQQALDYCRALFAQTRGNAVVVEEKLDGEEFSFQSFCDGVHVSHTVPVQDHKRAREGDKGPNTGGMGSYSCADHLLPFLRQEHIDEAGRINQLVCDALRERALREKLEGRADGSLYKGILYGGFMVTKNGLRLIEYNARFGDPEVMNVLPLLETDFVDICDAIINERLHELKVTYKKQATVCKYVVPKGYPDSPVKDVAIDLSQVPKPSDQLRIYYAALDRKEDHSLHMTGSRAIAFVGMGKDLAEAEVIAEQAASLVRGPVMHRRDIGTSELVQHRVDHMRTIESSHDVDRLRLGRAA